MENLDLGVLFIFGISIFGGLLGASFFQKIRVPQVVGYIVIGILIGESGLNIIKHSDIVALRSFSLFALGIIGFLVGGELKLDNFKKYGKQFLSILIGEGMFAFFLVAVPTICFMFFLFHDWKVAFATGIVLGAIASATDPASTIDVLWEYRSLGILTLSLTAVIALDDALAMTLYGLGTSIAKMLTEHESSLWHEQLEVWGSLLGAGCLGYLFALILKYFLKKFNKSDKNIPFAIGLLLLIISISVYLDFDVILTAMVMGFVLINISPRRSEDLFTHMRSYSAPIYILFFVLAGARISFQKMPGWLWALVFIYVVGRSVGKVLGAYAGARYANSPLTVRRYLGMGLFAQGGVAIGLSMMASQHLSSVKVANGLDLGEVIISGVAMTTFIVQLIGPPMVKLALKLSGEIGRNITKEDILASWKVSDVIDTEFVSVLEDEPLKNVAQKFVENDQSIFPVIQKDKTLVGIISLKDFKDIFADRKVWDWLIVSDIMKSITIYVNKGMPLEKVFSMMKEMHFNQLLVTKKDDDKLVAEGIIDAFLISKEIDKAVITKRQQEF